MIEAGYPWFGEARASVLEHIGREGTAQSDVVERVRLSKQAVQQLVDQLVKDGILQRSTNARDRRSKILSYAPAAQTLLADMSRIKQALDAEYHARLGEERFGALKGSLAALNLDDRAL